MIFRKNRADGTPVQPRSEGTVTVEDLLQFKKRAEQPEPEFWTDFERQLKHRQLAAAIRKERPWWHAIPRITAIALPAGATAALAIGVVIWRGESSAPQPPAPFAHQPAAPVRASADVTAPVAPATVLAHSAVSAAQQQQTPAASAPVMTAAAQQTAKPISAAEAAASQPVATRHIEAARNAFASVTTTTARARVTPAAFASGSLFNTKPATAKNTSPAALLAAPKTLGTDMVAAVQMALATNETSTITTLEFSPHLKPEEHMDPRRERLLTYTDTTIPVATPMADNPRVIRARDRVTSRFNDKSFTDSISRVATTGDSFTIKF